MPLQTIINPQMVNDLVNSLVTLADEVVRKTIAELPPDLRTLAGKVPVMHEPWPNDALVEEGWDEDLLGMFVGDGIDVAAGDRGPLPPQILLFYENLWDFAEGDETVYRDEVRITYLHELGHYLGLGEQDIEERGLL